jgi:hypothetical protein
MMALSLLILHTFRFLNSLLFQISERNCLLLRIMTRIAWPADKKFERTQSMAWVHGGGSP